MGGGGGRGGFPVPMGRGGLPILLLLVVLSVIGGGSLLGGGGGGSSDTAVERPTGGPGGTEDPADFISFVHHDAQQFWQRELGRDYQPAELVLFTDATQTQGCGSASSAVGPFYCPADMTVRMDLSFFDELDRRLGASGDFAQAYVVAHEMGHHVQNLLGTSSRVRQEQQRRPNEANELSVRLELQADCLAGMWAASVYDDLEEGDVEEALGAAEAIGDDRLQRQAGGRVNPESFTHGTSAQRKQWLQEGMGADDVRACDTFSASI
jgi:uncharacterized protein